MLRLSAFADEISPDIDEQVRVCRENAVTHIELRSVNKINVLDLTQAMRADIQRALDAGGLKLISVGSPIGKVAIDKPFSEHMDRFKIAVEIAEFFDAPYIRVFSYYPAGGEGKGPVDPRRNEVIERFHQKVEHLKGRPITLLHENEKGIYGDTGRRCADLMKSVNSPKLRAAFDFANFVQIGDSPLENWPMLKPYVDHIHIKDFRKSDHQVVPAGQGDGQMQPILTDAYQSGYRGFLSLEPHLRVAGHSHGETGPDLFKVAADTLKALCKASGIPLAGAS